MDFTSDNTPGASGPVMAALNAANEGHLPAYGADALTSRVEARLAEVFGCELAAFPVATGTAANALALAALTPPWGAVLTHEEGHAADDECGAPEFFTGGAKLVGLPGAGNKLDPATVAEALARMPAGVMKQVEPACLTISQATECGLVYTPAEVAALARIARGRGLTVHMDGARFANAVASLGCPPADVTWRAGVDALSLGATKDGCLCAEVVILFNPTPARAHELARRRKRSGHTLSKGRLLAAQLDAWLADGHWLDLARHANAMAARLAAGLGQAPGVRLAWERQANEVFPILPAAAEARLRAAGARFHPWSDRFLGSGGQVGEGERLVRLVASFRTTEAEVDALVALAGQG